LFDLAGVTSYAKIMLPITIRPFVTHSRKTSLAKRLLMSSTACWVITVMARLLSGGAV